MIIKLSDISLIKMSANPPKSVVDADYCVITDGKVHQYTGIGWIEIRTATQSDYESIPQVLSPHCSQCKYYECLVNAMMYCSKLKRRITSRKRPCKDYSE